MVNHVIDEFGEYHARGKSTDHKPIGRYPGNTIFEEMDTGDKYYYDELAKQWVACASVE